MHAVTRRPTQHRSALAVVLVMTVIASFVVAVRAADAATNLYVAQNDPHCSNTGAGTATAPFCTIGKAAAVATAGQVVTVMSGSYVENVTPASSGTSTAPITYQVGTGETVTVTGQIHAFTVSSKSWIVIRGFRVTATTGYGIYLKGASHVTLTGNRVDHVGQPVSGSTEQGIYLINTTDSLIAGNTADHNSDTGIYLTTGSTGNDIRGNASFSNARVYTRAATGIDVRAPGNTVIANVAYNNEDSGIQLYNGATGTGIFENVSYGNGDHGIDVLNSTDSVVVGNTVYNNKTSGINLEGSSGTTASSGGTLRNNISVDNGLTSTTTKGNIRVDAKSLTGTTLDFDLVSLRTSGTMMTWGTKTYASLGAFNSASGQEDNGIQADPQWRAAGSGDFHLLSGSPGIDSATSAAAGEPTTDIEGQPRVDDPQTPDIGVGPRTFDDRGAYEYQPDLPPSAALQVRPASGDAPLDVTADASASVDADSTPIASYAFDFGDGTPPVDPQPSPTWSHTYSLPGTYSVRVTVTDTAGLSSTTSASVRVTSTENPPTAALTVTPQSGAVPLDVVADASGSSDPDSTPIASYTFDFGDGTGAVGPQATATASHTYQAAGTWTATVTVTDTAGTSATASATVTVGNSTVDEVHYSYIGPTSVTFDWRGGPDSIRYGPTSSYGTVVQAATPAPLPYSSPGPYWEARLVDLQPGTTYHYSIGGSQDATFSTAPTGAFRFVALADVGDSVTYPRMGVIQSQIAADDPTAVLLAGDLTYAEAHGQQAADQHFDDVLAWSRTAAYMPAWGNHDWETTTDDLRNYKGRFDIPHQQASPGAPSLGCCGEDWGWFDAGGVRFISYPEPYSEASWTDWASKADTIMAAAQNDPSITYIVTFGHRPAYSTGNHPGSATLADMLDNLGDTYPKYVLNINGHSHDYERFQPIHGVTHLTVGGGGATLETPWSGTDPRTAFRAMHLGYVRVDVTSSTMTVQSVCGPASSKDDLTCAQGSVIDSVVIPAPGLDQPPAAALTTTPASGPAPLAVTADASSSTDTDATPIASYSFDFGDGTSSGAQAAASASHTYTSIGTYTVGVTVTDTAGRVGTATSTVAVTAPPSDDPPVAALTVTPTSGTAPLAVTADASSSTDVDATPIATYRFAWGDGSSTSTQTSATAGHTFSVAGSYPVTVSVTDTAGQVSTKTVTVTATSADSPPVAALTVSPSSGSAPLNVTADAGASTDTDATPIASYRFDFGDGTVVGPQSASSASHTYSTAGSYVVTVRVTDTGGLLSSTTSSVTVSPAAGANLVGNPGFEVDTSGWNGNGRAGIAVNRVAGGNSGSWSAQVANTTTSTQADCTLNDSPNWIKTTQTGIYTASLWVRADAAGSVLKVRLREYNGGVFVSSATAQITLSTTWQKASVSYAPQVAGSTLDLTVYTNNAAPGTCFYADDVAETAVS